MTIFFLNCVHYRQQWFCWKGSIYYWRQNLKTNTTSWKSDYQYIISIINTVNMIPFSIYNGTFNTEKWYRGTSWLPTKCIGRILFWSLTSNIISEINTVNLIPFSIYNGTFNTEKWYRGNSWLPTYSMTKCVGRILYYFCHLRLMDSTVLIIW
jgi:uncharacterized membrane protein